ncbi:hypothetical protein DERF_012933 [Dermatophagoides farinae]|uniref:Uncharacterized protein n=1 Tax=Dermatophagoides farinae TaxID=6954 RepID=A0A922KY81_DERFA|nr:hypothetical protein DERF_012933 [Dermatophagoides farinae]
MSTTSIKSIFEMCNPSCIGGHQLTVLFIYLLLNNYHRFFTISLTPTQQITNTVFNMNFIVYTQTQDTTQ